MTQQLSVLGFLPPPPEVITQDNWHDASLRPPTYPLEDPRGAAFMRERLALSGLVPEDVFAYPTWYWGRPAFVVPFFNEDGTYNAGMFDRRIDRDKNKYVGPSATSDLYLPPLHLRAGEVVNKARIYLIEGALKAAKYQKEYPDRYVLGMRGCTGYARKDGKLQPKLLSAIYASGIESPALTVIFDSDVLAKPQVSKAAARLVKLLDGGHRVTLILLYPPNGKGVDDWLTLPASTRGDLQELNQLELRACSISIKMAEALNCHVSEGKIKWSITTVDRILAAYYDGLEYDPAINKFYLGDEEFTDLYLHARHYIQDYGSFNVQYPLIKESTRSITPNIRSAVRELLLGAQWDGVPRLDTYGSQFIKPKYGTAARADEWFRMYWVGKTMRIVEPGCQVDFIFFIIGPEGYKKTSFFKEAATFPPVRKEHYYKSINKITTRGHSDSLTLGLQLQGAHDISLDEAEAIIDAVNQSKAEGTKNFVTRTEDEMRLNYSNALVVVPRAFVLSGTANDSLEITQAMGLRRWKIIEITTDLLRPGYTEIIPWEDRLQLYAEVIARWDELNESKWWESKLPLEEYAEELALSAGVITDVDKLSAVRYSTESPFAELLKDLISGGRLPRMDMRGQSMGVTYAINKQVLECLVPPSIANKYKLNREMNKLETSLSFPYTIKYANVTRSRLSPPPGWNSLAGKMWDGESDSPQVWAYTLEPKLRGS